MASNSRSDYIKDVPVDVDFSRILPPPSVSVPDIKFVKPIISTYDFLKEKKAIAVYHEASTKRKAEKQRQNRVEKESASTLPSTNADSASLPATSINSPPPVNVKQPLVWPDAILTPTQAERRTTLTPTVQNGTPASTSALSLPKGFESFDPKDFESATNLFDLMELKTIDDKAELEKLLWR